MIHVLIFAHVLGARESTGIVLPMLIAGDVFAILFYGKHANWSYIYRMIPPALLGICMGAWAMTWLDSAVYKPFIGATILLLVVLQTVRVWRPQWFENVPQSLWFAWSMGILAGTTTMMANAAGPVFGLYLLAIGLPKLEFVGTAAWFFLLINVTKIPFSWGLGLIRIDTLSMNLLLIPLVAFGLWLGRKLVQRISQRVFDSLILSVTAAAAIRMVLG
jgi:uncharacterized membrane protein YfcA